MAERQPPSVWDVWLARGLLVGGLWFAGTGLWDLIRAEAMRWDMLLMHALGIGAGILFLVGAWRMRGALRWDPSDNE
ncbi:hypothetical protein [Sandaracinobacter sp.]|jgi:hypothetical protein|uniref:hypothetical protein n=1 Tax=Sandaracinobacter sp. TaxID=2487581 RepID=UPI0035B13F6B